MSRSTYSKLHLIGIDHMHWGHKKAPSLLFALFCFDEMVPLSHRLGFLFSTLSKASSLGKV